MKIVMLGHSGAGKTTYLSLMYSEMQSGVGGFRVQAAGATHQQLLADARQIRSSRYPPATRQRASHDFTLSYNGSSVLPFTWRDHRGGAASGRSDDGADVAQLTADLKEADGIVMFLDAAAVATQPTAQRMAGRLAAHVLRAMHERPQVPTPLVIAATKCDLINTGDKAVMGKVVSPVQNLINGVAGTKHIVGTLLPISCGPSPMNVSVPVLWVLTFGVAGMAARLHAEVEQAAQEMNAAYAKDTFWDRLLSPLGGEPTWREIAERKRMEGMRTLARLQELIPPVEALQALLEGIEYF